MLKTPFVVASDKRLQAATWPLIRRSPARFVESVKTSVGKIGHLEHKPVLITSMDIRRYVRKLLELEVYDLAVLSHQELTEEITVQPLGKISL